MNPSSHEMELGLPPQHPGHGAIRLEHSVFFQRRAHRLAGTSVEDNMADPDRIADVYLQLHQQHRSTWTYEVVLRPWTEKW